MSKGKLLFAIISSLPFLTFLYTLFIFRGKEGFEAFGSIPYIGAMMILSIAITPVGIVHCIFEKIRGRAIGFFVLFTILASLPTVPLMVLSALNLI